MVRSRMYARYADEIESTYSWHSCLFSTTHNLLDQTQSILDTTWILSKCRIMDENWWRPGNLQGDIDYRDAWWSSVTAQMLVWRTHESTRVRWCYLRMWGRLHQGCQGRARPKMHNREISREMLFLSNSAIATKCSYAFCFWAAAIYISLAFETY